MGLVEYSYKFYAYANINTLSCIVIIKQLKIGEFNKHKNNINGMVSIIVVKETEA